MSDKFKVNEAGWSGKKCESVDIDGDMFKLEVFRKCGGCIEIYDLWERDEEDIEITTDCVGRGKKFAVSFDIETIRVVDACKIRESKS